MTDKDLKLHFYPHVSLIAPTSEVVVFNTDLHALLDAMKLLMEKHKGVGLAATQVGHYDKMFVMKSKEGRHYELINPTILEQNGSKLENEGCLSAPGIFLPIVRAASLVVKFQDRHGVKQKMYCEDQDARCVQHEMEHLNQDFYFNRVNRQLRKIAISKVKKNVPQG